MNDEANDPFGFNKASPPDIRVTRLQEDYAVLRSQMDTIMEKLPGFIGDGRETRSEVSEIKDQVEQMQRSLDHLKGSLEAMMHAKGVTVHSHGGNAASHTQNNHDNATGTQIGNVEGDTS